MSSIPRAPWRPFLPWQALVALATTIAARCTEVESGARNIDFILRKSLTPRLSDLLLAAVADQRPLSALHVAVDAQGEWIIRAEEAAAEHPVQRTAV